MQRSQCRAFCMVSVWATLARGRNTIRLQRADFLLTFSCKGCGVGLRHESMRDLAGAKAACRYSIKEALERL